MPTNPYVEITEALAKELAKVRAELAQRQETGEITPEQVCDLMYQAFINGIQWALDNMPELAGLGENRGMSGSEKNMAQLLQWLQQPVNVAVSVGGSAVGVPSSHWKVGQSGGMFSGQCLHGH